MSKFVIRRVEFVDPSTVGAYPYIAFAIFINGERKVITQTIFVSWIIFKMAEFFSVSGNQINSSRISSDPNVSNVVFIHTVYGIVAQTLVVNNIILVGSKSSVFIIENANTTIFCAYNQVAVVTF